jgi:selenium-binding protein 1
VEEHQLVFELRPAHDPTKAYGFVNCVISLKDLSSSIWTWFREGEKWVAKKIITIQAEPAYLDQLPPVLKGFKACPPLVTDIDLSMDDRFLYVSCWGTGDLQQYDVSDPFNPKLTGKVRIGGIVARAAHPGAAHGANGKLGGGPQMVEVSRDGRRVYFTNSLYGAIDPQFYEGGFDGWMVKPTPTRPAALPSIRSFFCSGRRDGCRIRSGCKAATAPLIPIVIPEQWVTALPSCGLGP